MDSFADSAVEGMGSGLSGAEHRALHLERELLCLKRQYVARMRELGAMASLRETIASSVLQATASKSSSPNEFTGPGMSPCDSNVSSQSPPNGAEVRLPENVFSCFLLTYLSRARVDQSSPMNGTSGFASSGSRG